MRPQLISIGAKLRGATFYLEEEEMLIGRDAANHICLNDTSVSRRHCLIKAGDAGRFTLTDLDSFNRTFVNGIPIKEKELEEGDRIEIGNILLLYLTSEESDVGQSAIQIDDSLSSTESVIRLARDEAIYLNLENVKVNHSSDQVLQDLNALLRISTIINSISELAQLQNELLKQISEVIPALHIAILLVEPHRHEIISDCVWVKDRLNQKKLSLSRTVVQQVLDERVSLLCNNVKTDEKLRNADSLLASQICSVLCVPITAFSKTLGVIYAETNNPAAFEENHLQFLTGVASIAAVALQNAQQVQNLKSDYQTLNEQINLQHTMIGESRQIREIYNLIARVAPTDSTVLILGESGTGKELAARAIHQNSTRGEKPFFAINCAVLSETLIESELFGHERGAFTGAVNQKRGKLELANGSTLFLDEIGELALSVQAKLLRVLQEREFERVGGNRSISVDVRIIAATNRDLRQDVQEGRFRQDLYYRLNVVSFEMPPLRKRKSDIPLLANYFLCKYSDKCKRKVTNLSPKAKEYLLAYDWSGNIRELENVIERAIVLGQTETIEPEDLPEDISETSLVENETDLQSHSGGLYALIREEKRRLISEALKEAQGNYNAAAQKLGIHPNNLHRLMRELKLKTN